MYKNNANSALRHIAKAIKEIEDAGLECLYGDDGIGYDYATQSQLRKAKQQLMEIQEKIINDTKGHT